MKKINGKFILPLILGLLLHQPLVNASKLGLVMKVADWAWTAFSAANSIHDTYTKFTTPSTDDIMDKTGELSDSLDTWGASIEAKIQESTDMLLSRLPLASDMARAINTLTKHVGRIDELYSDMKEYVANPEDFSEQDLRALLKTFKSREGDDVQGTINAIYNMIVPKAAKLKKSLFLLMAEETQVFGLELCDTSASPQQRLIDISDMVMESEMKGIAMYAFGTMMEEYLDKVDLSADLNRLRMQFMRRAKAYLKMLKQTLKLAARRFRRCDAYGGQEEGVTYYEFGRFMQATVVQEAALAQDAEKQCSEDCEGYSQPTTGNHECEGYGCEATALSCNGRLTDCERLVGDVTVCEHSATSARRYQWFKDDKDEFGQAAYGCPGNLVTAKPYEKEYWCDVCKCICVDDSPSSFSTRFVNTRDQTTDVANNMVAVGIKFEMIGQMLHLSLQQAKLEPDADIDEKTAVWLEPENIQYDAEKSSTSGKPVFIKKSENGDDEELKQGSDFGSFTWEDRRWDLDSLQLPKGYILTGVRFHSYRERGRTSVRLEIQGTLFDGKEGLLDLDSPQIWVKPDEMKYARRYTGKWRDQYVMKGFRNPTKSVKTAIDSKPWMYLDMKWSDWEWDAAQTTLPLLDALPLTADPAAPLVGVGLLHKRQTGYGGFLTLVLEAIDISEYVPKDLKVKKA